MNIDATFWVAISFFIFCGGLVYLKVPQKINNVLNDQIEKIKKEINEAKNLGDVLIVSVTTDQYVDKGPGRPFFTLKHRMQLLSSIKIVPSLIVIF